MRLTFVSGAHAEVNTSHLYSGFSKALHQTHSDAHKHQHTCSPCTPLRGRGPAPAPPGVEEDPGDALLMTCQTERALHAPAYFTYRHAEAGSSCIFVYVGRVGFLFRRKATRTTSCTMENPATVANTHWRFYGDLLHCVGAGSLKLYREHCHAVKCSLNNSKFWGFVIFLGLLLFDWKMQLVL